VAAMNWVESGSGFKANSPDELMLALSRIGTLNRSRRFVWRGAAPVDKATGIISGKGVSRRDQRRVLHPHQIRLECPSLAGPSG
jgi:hypothetical protein